MRAVLGWDAAKRRHAAVAFLFVALASVVAVVAVPLWLAHRHYDDALEDMDQRLTRYERLASAKPVLERKLEAVRAADARKYFLKASAASLSAAEIQERARQFIDSNGGRLISIQVGTPREDGRFRQVAVILQLNASTPALRRILLALEAAEPYLFVDSLMSRAQVPPGFKALPGIEPEMFIQLEISGFSVAG